MTNPDEIIIEAVAFHDGKFPDLASGVMFFKGLRITRKQFENVGMGLSEPRNMYSEGFITGINYAKKYGIGANK